MSDMTNLSRHGNLIVISGPSGAGKGTLVKRLKTKLDDVWVSVSATTRCPREGEVEGRDYYFKTDEQFDELIKNDGLLEWASVHDKRYGTPRKPVEEQIALGKQVILEIEPQGAFQVRAKFPDAKLVFIDVPSMEELEKRLVGRGTENACQIASRLATAKVELSRKKEYNSVVMNDDINVATEKLVDVIDGYALA